MGITSRGAFATLFLGTLCAGPMQAQERSGDSVHPDIVRLLGVGGVWSGVGPRKSGL